MHRMRAAMSCLWRQVEARLGSVRCRVLHCSSRHIVGTSFESGIVTCFLLYATKQTAAKRSEALPEILQMLRLCRSLSSLFFSSTWHRVGGVVGVMRTNSR